MRVSCAYRVPEDRAQRAVQRAVAWEAPALPHASGQLVPRWAHTPTWTPPGTILLVRHRSLDGGRCVVTNDRVPPPGFAIEFDLGLVHAFAQPGTARLVATDDGFFTTPFEGELADGLRALGHVEQAPLPMLEGLELRRDPDTGQVTLVAGPADPLYARAEPVGHVGFIESYPINPREPLDVRVDRDLLTLVREVDERAWRHRYAAVPERGEGVALGGIWARPRPDTTPLWRDPDGTIGSDLLAPARCVPGAGAVLRWTAAPLAWAGRRLPAWALRAAASRVRAVATRAPAELVAAAGRRGGGRAVIGHLRREPAPGWSQLFSARHPVLPDQYLTRSELEARDMGYVVEGIVGYVADRRADTDPTAMPREIKWASRFGHRRRYVEGPIP